MVNRKRALRRLIVLATILIEIRIFVVMFWFLYIHSRRRHLLPNFGSRKTRYSMTTKTPYQINHIRDIIGVSDDICRNNLRMPINTFQRLCFLLENVGGLSPNKHITVEEQVVMFLSIISHHKKNVTIQTDFKRSGHTVSIYFHRVLAAVLKLYPLLVTSPQPVHEGSTDHRWKYFKVFSELLHIFLSRNKNMSALNYMLRFV